MAQSPRQKPVAAWIRRLETWETENLGPIPLKSLSRFDRKLAHALEGVRQQPHLVTGSQALTLCRLCPCLFLASDRIWLERYNEYVRCHQDGRPLTTSLHNWVIMQRSRYRKGKLVRQRELWLRQAGEPLRYVLHDRWLWVLEEYKTFLNTHQLRWIGPRDNAKLHTWMKHQLAYLRNGKLPEVRAQRIRELGIHESGLAASRMDDLLDRLKRHHAFHGHCRVTQKTADAMGDPHLNPTARSLRNQPHRLLPEHRAQLDAMGFLWDPRTVNHDTKIEQLREFVKQQGHSFPEPGHPLHIWARKLRLRRTKGRISVTLQQKLEAAGFEWGALDSTVLPLLRAGLRSESPTGRITPFYKRLLAFKKQFGHTQVPKTFDRTLSFWVKTMRYQKRKGTLRPAWIAALDAIGFVWEPGQGKRPPRPPGM